MWGLEKPPQIGEAGRVDERMEAVGTARCDPAKTVQGTAGSALTSMPRQHAFPTGDRRP